MASQSPDLEKKAKEAFVDDDFELAVDLYTQALELSPGNADLFADRAQANIKLGSFTEAVADSNKAIEMDRSMAKAYLRKGTACMKLEEYQTAKAALEAGAALAPEDSRFSKLVKECEARIAEETTNLSNAPPSFSSPLVDKTTGSTKDSGLSANDVSTVAALPQNPKYRHNFYNSHTEVVVTIFAKSIPPEYVSVEFGEQILRVVIDVPGEDVYHLQTRLFAKIIPETCRYTVFSSKIEIRLSKAETTTWTSLEFCDKKIIRRMLNATPVQSSQRPSYPSSKSKTDWDKLEAEVKKEEKEEKLEGDAALNKLFRDIYKDADEDTRRAMSKSFVESNGTVLSTNWKEVGSKVVEGSAPQGMEMKKWEI